ncbi:F0F1 ATP synthase subunit A [bacterium]|nr:F0F1 ATP synthase subunit A [bacterium]
MNKYSIQVTFVMIAIIMILLLFFFIIFLILRKVDPLKPNKLFLFLELIVDNIDNFVVKNMGDGFSNFGSYILTLILFIPFCFLVGIIGLPNPFTFLSVPFSLSFCTFCLIHITSLKFTKKKYFKRFFEPFPVFLPINLLSMWIPLISLALRLFGNVFAGWILSSMFYGALDSVLNNLESFIGNYSFFSLPIFSLLASFFHLYFDIFSCLIQTAIFVFLSVLFVAMEKPNDYNLKRIEK